MTQINTYKNDFPDTYKDNWIKILFNNNRPIQSRELLELQGILQNNSKKIFDTIYKNGTVIEGLDITLANTYPSGVRSFTCSKGVVYIEGNFIAIPESTFTVVNTTSTIGVLINEQVITELEDASLNDPEKGGELWGAAGAYRLRWTGSIAVDATSMYPFAKIESNKVIRVTPTDSNKQLLANYIYDAEGNFIIKGFNTSNIGSSTGASNSNNLNNLLTQQESITNNINDLEGQIQSLVDSNNRINSSLATYKQQILLQYTANLAALIVNSEALIESNTNTINDLTNKLTVLRQNNSSLQSNIDTEKAIQVNLETVSISPGIGYVEGNRIVKTSNTILSIQKNLPTSQIYNAVFNYSGTSSFVSYQFSGLNLSTVINNKSLIRILLSNVVFNGVEHIIQADLSIPNTITSIADIVLFIVNEFNNSITSSTFSCATLSLNNNDLLAVIKQNYEVILTNNSTITFKFITLRNSSSVPNIGISLLKRDTNNIITGPGTGLTITRTLTTNSSSSLNSYKLGFTPVSAINRLSATLIATSKPIIRGAVPGTSDTLGQATISRIISVGKDFTSYIEGVDYRLNNQSEIDWSLPSINEPTPGTTYFVTYLYSSILTNNVDYKLDNDSVVFINRTPAIGQTFSVDYSYYQSRAGVITLDRDGNIDYILSDASINPTTPSTPSYLLPICTFKLQINNSSFQSIGLNKYTNKDLYNLSNRLTQAVFALEDKPELISDNFLSYATQDISNSAYTAAICPNKQSITTGYKYSEISINTSEASRYLLDSYVSLPLAITPTNYLVQDRVTENKVLTSSPYKPILRLSSYSLFYNSNKAKVNPSNSFNTNTSKINNRININNQSLFGLLSTSLEEALQTNNAFNSNSYDQESENYISNNITTLTNLSIDLFLTDLDPVSTNYKVFIDNVLVQSTLVLLNGTLAGTTTNTFKSNPSGKATVRVLLPSNLSTGTHTIEVRNITYSIKSKFSVYNNLLNHVVFDATNKNVRGAIIPPYLLEEPTTYNLEQTFIATDYYYLNSIILTTNKTPTISSELTVLLLDSDRNIISYGEAVLFLNNKVTVKFLTPALIERDKEYIIALKSPQQGFSFSIAKVNDLDINNGSYFGNQLFSNGCLYYSQDNTNSLQLTEYDLTYTLTRDSFTANTKTVNLGTYTVSLITSFALNTRDVVPPLTSITYEYAIEDGIWKEFTPNRHTQLVAKANILSIRATLYTNNLNISPLLLIKGSSISLYSNNSSSSLISTYIPHGNNYSNVTIKVGYIKTTSSNLTVYHSQQSTNETWKNALLTTTSLIDESINLYESIYIVSYTTAGIGSKYRVDTISSDTTQPLTIKYIYVNPQFI
jgi:hypothetical protein